MVKFNTDSIYCSREGEGKLPADGYTVSGTNLNSLLINKYDYLIKTV